MAILALSPLFTLIFSISILKWTAMKSCLASIALALFLSLLVPQFGIDKTGGEKVIFVTIFLCLKIAMIIIPGLLLNATLRKQKIISDISQWFKKLPIDKGKKALILILGIIPAIESLTGFGVSLFVSIPILFGLFDKDKALKMGFLGINIMPWGTLALATTMGANIISIPLRDLGELTSFTSSLIFPFLGIATVKISQEGSVSLIDYIWGFLFGVMLSVSLYFCNIYCSVETAGIIAGLLVTILGITIFKRGPIELSKGLTLFMPYLTILVLVSISKFKGVEYFLENSFLLKGPEINFAPFSGPGILLFIALFIQMAKRPQKIKLSGVIKKSSITLGGMGVFLLLSQIMIQTGMILAIVNAISKLMAMWQYYLISPLVGAFSGFITGSNLGGNVLFMKTQFDLGNTWNLGTIFAAIQNSSAGHAVFMSFPMLILVKGIARDEVRSGINLLKDHEIFKFNFKILICHLLVIYLATIFYFLEMI